MYLLVSVRDAAEALAAVAGGADIVDAKEPNAGALGAVGLDRFRRIVEAVNGRCPVTAALGDATDEEAVARDAVAYMRAGAGLVKIGFAGTRDARHVERLVAAAVRGASAFERHRPADVITSGENARSAGDPPGVIAVAYADAHAVAAIAPDALIESASCAGARGVLLDTACKSGPGVCELMATPELAAWIDRARSADLLVAVAGKLTADQLLVVRDAGADIAGVRGAACENGRTGSVTAALVRRLHERIADATLVAGTREAARSVSLSS